MAKNRRKSAAIALAVLGVAGLSLASASQLTLSTGTLQAGSIALTDCQTTTVPVTYTTTFTGGAYQVTGVRLANVAAACAGKTATVKLLNAAGTEVATGTAATVAGNVDVTLVAPAAVANVASVAAVIAG